MKKLLLLAVCLVSAFSAVAQGSLNFSNGAVGVNAPINNVGGATRVSGTGFAADLYYGAGVISEASSLTALGANVAFGTGANAGYFFGGTRFLPNGFAAGSVITVQVRAWRLSDGADYGTALGNNGQTGFSNLFQLTLGPASGNPGAIPNLVGLQSFTLTQVPEPSTFALGALGIGALLMVRRRKA